MAQPRNFFAAAALTFVLAGATLADDGIIYGGYAPTPTPTPVIHKSSLNGDDPPTPPAPSDDEVTATDIAIESALRVLAGMFLMY